MAYPDCPSGVCGGQSSGEGLKAIQLPGGSLDRRECSFVTKVP